MWVTPRHTPPHRHAHTHTQSPATVCQKLQSNAHFVRLLYEFYIEQCISFPPMPLGVSAGAQLGVIQGKPLVVLTLCGVIRSRKETEEEIIL